MSKHEQTVLRALRDGWYIEEILQLIHIDPLTIHRIAKRHGLKARHAPHRPNFMRHKAIADAAKSGGCEYAANLFRLAVGTVQQSCRLFLEMDKQRRPAT